MTHPEYRNHGLSASLINLVLEEYKNHYDFMYLFANQHVLDFYPKFGFQRVNEYQFSMTYSPHQSVEAGRIRKLDGSNIKDLKFIYKVASERVPVSNLFGTLNSQGVLMFYCIYVFNNDIYYIEDQDAIVIFRTEGRQTDIFDIISKKEINIHHILPKITNRDTNKIVFHYTPSYKGIDAHSQTFSGADVLFVKTSGSNYFPLNVKHPITSQA
ncbi:GNAT family N-acetyltransferase [Bacillus sp. JCM 19034]|uniref:GNAT family N-acetyltransferase n=1 Tax=Bacillus sp. JCM 19034 TaxID=1481928 RepID=UPI000AA9F456|nr:GNAT family N-acetyltransferase [Bacillus sp. JCM 19034]